jgi:hypothetical protein
VSFARKLARGRDSATPARALVTVGAVIAAVVVVLVLLVYAIQSLL